MNCAPTSSSTAANRIQAAQRWAVLKSYSFKLYEKLRTLSFQVAVEHFVDIGHTALAQAVQPLVRLHKHETSRTQNCQVMMQRRLRYAEIVGNLLQAVAARR